MNDSARPLGGRNVVITGASSGIGFEIAKALAAMGARLALVCRDAGRGEAARAAIAADSSSEDVRVVRADLGMQADVRRAAAELADAFPEIHVLVHNAGTAQWQRTLTADGIETTFAVNHLAPFLLTHLLLKPLKAAMPSRVDTVASAAHRRATMDWGNLQGERRYRAWGAYSRSKLANILFTRELARRIDGTGVVANCCHPGTVNTRIWQMNSVLRALAPLLGPLLRTPARGAETPVYVAASEEGGRVSGVYFADRHPTPTSRAAEDRMAALRLWEISERLTGVA